MFHWYKKVKTFLHYQRLCRKKALLEANNSLSSVNCVSSDIMESKVRSQTCVRRLRIQSLKIKSLVKVFMIFVLAFFILILLLNHSVTRKLLSERPLGNYEPAEEEVQGGPGQMGKPHFTRVKQAREVDAAFAEYGINMVCSSEISLHRSLPDLRLPECKYWHYSEDLLMTSVVIVFYNEGLTPLLRNINAIIDRTPPQFLQEILLVDDCSEKEELKSKLEWHVKRYKGLVKIMRNEQRQGLIQARVTGAKKAIGQALVFLDAHCEVNVNWLPPLIDPITRNWQVVTIPVIDSIDKYTFAYTGNYDYHSPNRGIFDWGLLNKEISVPLHELQLRRNASSPYRTPSHQGGLFAIDRDYFESIGFYDDGLLVWGAENHDLSFKVWQCGGAMIWVPCSRIGHIFRSMPDRLGSYVPPRQAYAITNFKRVAEIWFDDKYKEYFYTIYPSVRYLNMGNITKQLELKKKLQCRSFDWYMEYIAFDVYRDFPAPPPNLHWGELKNFATSKCLDKTPNSVLSSMETSKCHGRGRGQLFRINIQGQLAIGERCVVADLGEVKVAKCRLGRADGPWEYKTPDKLMYNTEWLRCLGQHPRTRRVMLLPCDTKNTYLKWTFQKITHE